MKKNIILILMISSLLVSCSVETEDAQNKAQYHKISAEEAKAMMNDEGVKVVDVREQNEYDEGHIDGAILVPLGSIKTEIETVASSKDDVLLIYCRSGNRSETASRALVNLGYSEVYDFGGIIDWPYDIVK